MQRAARSTTASWRVSQRTARRKVLADAGDIVRRRPTNPVAARRLSIQRTSSWQVGRSDGAAVVRSRRGDRTMTPERACVGVVGDFDAANRTHRFTNDALDHVGLAFEWVMTDAAGDWDERLSRYDGVWIAPASPYRSMDGALAAAPWSAPEEVSSTRSSSSRATFSGTETPTTPRRTPAPSDSSSRRWPAHSSARHNAWF
jgi:hypothetical protein